MQTQLLDALAYPAESISTAAALLQRGELVAFPTETVYGLGARVFDAEQVQKIFIAKKRPQDNPLIAHIAEAEQAQRIVRSISPIAQKLMQKFFPGALTLVLPKHPDVPAIVSAGLDSIAFRMPAHTLALELIRSVGQPLVAPSANLSGKPSPTTAKHVLQDMQGRIAAVLDGGECGIGIESTVLSLLEATPRILRPGAIHAEMIEEVLGQRIIRNQPLDASNSHELAAVHSPGMKYRHYAPSAQVQLIHDWSEVPSNELSLILASENPHHREDVRPLSTQSLYAEFRRADDLGITRIYILLTKDIVAQEGLMNRIMKACEFPSS